MGTVNVTVTKQEELSCNKALVKAPLHSFQREIFTQDSALFRQFWHKHERLTTLFTTSLVGWRYCFVLYFSATVSF